MRGYLSFGPLIVKGVRAAGPMLFFWKDRDLRATILPECVATLFIVSGGVTMLGTVWLAALGD